MGERIHKGFLNGINAREMELLSWSRVSYDIRQRRGRVRFSTNTRFIGFWISRKDRELIAEFNFLVCVCFGSRKRANRFSTILKGKKFLRVTTGAL